MVIAVGLYNEVYRNWARNSYSRIEAAVHQAAEQQRKLKEQLEEYNRLVPEEDIRKMQQVLKDLNIYHGEVTGKYNEELLIAVAGYQQIANTISSVAAVWRSQSKSGKYEFEVDGKVTKELLELALAEKGLGIRNNPDLVNNGGTITAITMVGVGDGIASQLKEDFGDVLKGSWANNPNNIEFWTKTLPHYYDLAKDIENGNITYDSIKSMLGEELAKEFIVPFKDIKNLSGKVLSGKASYEESVSYGRALAKAASAVMLVKAAATAGAKGAKLASKSSNELLESLPKITEQFRRSEFVTPEGIRVKVSAWEADGTISYSKNPTQQNLIENYLKEREGKGRVEGTGNLIFKSDYDDHLVNVKKFDRDPSKGITGGHNMDEFYKYFRNVLKLDDVDFINKVTPHPTIDGIIQINYKIPKLDNKGNLTGEYKYFKNPKTVYDPSKISEVTIIEWGKAAMQQGIDAGSIVGRRITGIAPNGLKFEGYMDESGVITNFYPKLD
ncbi:EndoU domain-containing protein [Paenibacillus sp. Marseille-P2973]|nr:EndoU domain-containing protein [Paenibacillus sp. Marseille-P2973]